HGAKYTFLDSGSKAITIHITDESGDYDTFDFRNIVFEHHTNDMFISFDNQGGFVISISNNATNELTDINVFRKNMTSFDGCRSLIYLPSGDVFYISDIYKMSRGRKSVKLNVEKKPDINDIINVAILETSYLQIKKIPNNDDGSYVLCLDNPNLSSYTLHFNDLSGYISSIWDNIRGSFTPFHNNTVNIAPNEKKFISLTEPDKLSFNIDVFREALEVKNSYKLSKFTWETYGDIVVSPEDRISHLELDGFNYFSQPELDAQISDTFSYLYDNFQIADGDVHIKLLHLDRETKQITPHRIILQKYFIDSFAKTSISDRENNIYPVICDSPDHFTNDIYRHPFRIVLGNKTLYPSEELIKFIRTSKEYLSNMDIINNIIVPQKTIKKNKLSVVSLNSNLKNEVVLSGVMTGTSKVFHLNKSGDLLLTTSKTHGGGVIVIFKDFINNWWKYNLTLITVPIDDKLSDNRINITPMGITIHEIVNGDDKLFFYPTPLKNGGFILHNPLYTNSFPSSYSHELFDLVEAYRNPTYSYLQNSIINRYIHTVSEHNGKDGVAQMSLPIYAYSTCRFWPKESVAVGDTINLSNYEHIEFSFNSFSKDVCREQNSDIYKIFFKIVALNNSIVVSENMFTQKNFLEHNTFFSVTGIDESLYEKHIIFITLKAIPPQK
ncbi:DUF3491 domain-containing protein, partial [Escherichia coli]|nr:DUF3491 domain-containing protein [Escherichia coli]EEW7121534.1 DUF3491 domain-containing protein [Escherichia coli]